MLEKDGARYALRWPSLDPATMESAGIFDANRARNWKEFTEALSHYSGPTQNFVYADVDGHIGYYGAGASRFARPVTAACRTTALPMTVNGRTLFLSTNCRTATIRLPG
jgi:penicillin amidase